MTTRIGINGFGGIGRAFCRSLELPDIEVVAVNDVTDVRTLASLLEYDSAHGRFPASVVPTVDPILIGGKPIRALTSATRRLSTGEPSGSTSSSSRPAGSATRRTPSCT